MGQQMLRVNPVIFILGPKREDVLVFSHGQIRHFHGLATFPSEQHLSIETPGWRLMDFQGYSLTGDESERQGEKFQKDPLAAGTRKHTFA